MGAVIDRETRATLENPPNDPHLYGSSAYDRNRIINLEKNRLFNKWWCDSWLTRRKKIKIRFLLHSIHNDKFLIKF